MYKENTANLSSEGFIHFQLKTSVMFSVLKGILDSSWKFPSAGKDLFCGSELQVHTLYFEFPGERFRMHLELVNSTWILNCSDLPLSICWFSTWENKDGLLLKQSWGGGWVRKDIMEKTATCSICFEGFPNRKAVAFWRWESESQLVLDINIHIIWSGGSCASQAILQLLW